PTLTKLTEPLTPGRGRSTCPAPNLNSEDGHETSYSLDRLTGSAVSADPPRSAGSHDHHGSRVGRVGSAGSRRGGGDTEPGAFHGDQRPRQLPPGRSCGAGTRPERGDHGQPAGL